MLVRRQDVELLAAVRGMAVAHQPEVLQDVEGAIDGRGDRGRIEVAAPVDELAACHVTVRP